MKRASIYRRWSDERLAAALARAARRAARLADELNSRLRAHEKRLRRFDDEARAKAKDREESFLLAHRANGEAQS